MKEMKNWIQVPYDDRVTDPTLHGLKRFKFNGLFLEMPRVSHHMYGEGLVDRFTFDDRDWKITEIRYGWHALWGVRDFLCSVFRACFDGDYSTDRELNRLMFRSETPVQRKDRWRRIGYEEPADEEKAACLRQNLMALRLKNP